MSEPKCHINERLHTGLAQSGRAAGMGISYDRYDDESGNPDASTNRMRRHRKMNTGVGNAVAAVA